MPPKTVALVGAACVTAGWLLASVVSPPVARVQTMPERRAPRQEPVPPTDAFTEQLELRMRQAPAAPTPRRNPFVFGNRSRVAAPEPSVVETLPVPPLDEPAMAISAGPAYTLSGLALTATDSGPVRTAIVSDGTTVHLVKAGERLGDYLVSKVSDDVVVLTDAAGRQLLLRLP